jgi:murein DD-endopeptidase MepM/ murein hydrolase activator NlpD
MPSRLSTIMRRLLIGAVFIAITYAALPWLALAWYAVQLSAMAPPSVLAMPVSGLAARDLRDTWHAARPPNRRHEGIDIFAEKGTPVLAATEGIVLQREQTPVGGKVLWVLGPAGHRHYYAHLERFGSAGPGDRIRPGALLGYVGNTGNARSTPPHLHYGLYGDDGAINPYPLLTRAAEKAGQLPTPL